MAFTATKTESVCPRFWELLADATEDLIVYTDTDSIGAENTVAEAGGDPGEGGSDFIQWPKRTLNKIAAEFPGTTFQFERWNKTSRAYEAIQTVQTGTDASPKVVKMRIVGTGSWSTQGQQPDLDAMFDEPGHLVLIGILHNNIETALDEDLEDFLTGHVQMIRSLQPFAEVVLIAQPPAFNKPGLYDRLPMINRRVAAKLGCGFINVTRAFLTYPGASYANNFSPLIETSGVHPTDPGYELYANVVFGAVRGGTDSQPRTAPPVIFRNPGVDLLKDGMFERRDETNPSDISFTYWTKNNCTVQKVTTNTDNPSGVAFLIKPVDPTQPAFLSQQLGTNASIALRNRFVTLSAHFWLDEDEATNGYNGYGNVGFRDSDTVTTEQPDNLKAAQGFAGPRWNWKRKKIMATSTSVEVRFYATRDGRAGTDPTWNSSQHNVYLNRVNLVYGTQPMDPYVPPFGPDGSALPGGVTIDNNGRITSPKNGSTGGIAIGTDGFVYRSETAGLRFINKISVGASVSDAQPTWRVDYITGLQSGGAGGSTAPDVTWGRRAAGVFGLDNGQRVRLQVSGNVSSLSRDMAGLDLQMGSTSTGSLTAAVKFLSADTDLTTEQPKLLGVIVGRSLEAINADTKGGLAVDVWASPTGPGASGGYTKALSVLTDALHIPETVTAPATPPAGMVAYWHDSAAGRVRAKKSDGSVRSVDWLDRSPSRIQPANALAVTMDVAAIRNGITGGVALISGRPRLEKVRLIKGDVISGAGWLMRTQATAAAVTNRWFFLADANRQVLAISADDPNLNDWSAGVRELAFTASYTVPATGDYYVGICEAVSSGSPTELMGDSPGPAGLSLITKGGNSATTGQTTPVAVGTTFGTISVGAALAFAYATGTPTT